MSEIKSDNGDTLCYAVIEEWLYPTESGRDFLEEFDTRSEAWAYARAAADGEFENYQAVCGDCKGPERYEAPDGETGYVLAPSNELDQWFCAVRVIPVRKFGLWPTVAKGETKKGE